eukprot:365081-Chlamydomonas_euryale.AAC.4
MCTVLSAPWHGSCASGAVALKPDSAAVGQEACSVRQDSVAMIQGAVYFEAGLCCSESGAIPRKLWLSHSGSGAMNLQRHAPAAAGWGP